MQRPFKNTVFAFLIMGLMSNVTTSYASSWFSIFDDGEPSYTYCHISLDPNTNLKEFGAVLWQVAKNDQYRGILLLIDNSGGSAAVYSYLHDTILRIRKIKPVVALVTGSALSGGYWVASAADYIIAHGASDIGSIGVYREIQRWSDTQVETGSYKAKVVPYILTAGKYKGISNPYKKEFSEDEERYLREDTEKTYQHFLESVASDRGLSVKDAKAWADGKSFIASDALTLHLIDEIGTRFEAEQKLFALIKKRHACK